jgi:hypothetical protein
LDAVRTLRLTVVCLFVIPALLSLSRRLLPGAVSKGRGAGTLYAPAGGVKGANGGLALETFV